MNIELEKEIAKISGLKENLKEMGASLWQGSFRKKVTRIRITNARK